MKRHALFFTLLISLFLLGNQLAVAESSLFDFGSKKETPVAAAMAKKITATLKKLPEEGTHLTHIKLIEGIRAMDDEIASAGEIKILVDFDWQALPSHPDQRQALDNAAARIIRTVFFEHNDITKLRVIVKIPKGNGDYQSAAKVFSFTRATWELTKNDMRYHPDTATGAANLLALGDYVVVTEKGWIRGY
ncbi:MAG: hypothetical protein LUQ18_08815 [Methylococcaceae bacterium]|nr:hypothetical protein [Methylococcaceae bacterium]